MTTIVDLGGNTLITENIRVGATGPGQAGTDVSSAEIAVLDGVTAGTAAASKAVVLGASKEIATITTATITNLTTTTLTPTTIAGGSFSSTPTLGTGTTINLDSGTSTGSSHAATITKYATVYTTEALTTAAGSSQDEVITLTGIAAGDLAFVQRAGGTNTRLAYSVDAVTTSNTLTLTIKNNEPTNALNGTLKFNIWILKA